MGHLQHVRVQGLPPDFLRGTTAERAISHPTPRPGF